MSDANKTLRDVILYELRGDDPPDLHITLDTGVLVALKNYRVILDCLLEYENNRLKYAVPFAAIRQVRFIWEQ